MPFCTKCGKPLTGNARFCTNCGKPVAGIQNINIPVSQEQYIQPTAIPTQQIKPDESFKAVAGFFSKYKVIIFSTIGIVILLIAAYVIFLKPNPEKDGKSVGSLICACREDSAKNNLAMHKQFRDEFASKQYKTRAEAKGLLMAIEQSKQTKYDSCYNEALKKLNEKSQKYYKNASQYQKFEKGFYSKQNSCSPSASVELAGIQLEIYQKINSIVDPDPDTEKIKNDLIGNSIDGWSFDYLSEFQKCEIANKTKGSDRIEYTLNLKIARQNETNPHDASVTVVYIQTDNGWLFNQVKGNSITYTYELPTGVWQTYSLVPNSTYTINSGGKRFWVKEWEYGTSYKGGGSDADALNLTSSSLYMASRELEPIKIVFTYYPKQSTSY